MRSPQKNNNDDDDDDDDNRVTRYDIIEQNNTNSNPPSDASDVQAKRKRRRMKQVAVMLAILVAAIIAAVVVVLGNNNTEAPVDENHDENAATTTTTLPSLAPTQSPNNNEPSISGDNIFDNFDESVSLTDNFQILQVVDHDSTAFTQGLYYHQDTGLLTEGTGIYGRSLVRIWDPLTGQVLKETPSLDSEFFGEGVAWYVDQDGNERFIQLTWKAQRAFIYDTDLNLLQSFSYNQRTTTNQGWGITFDPVEKIFYVSDGSRYIHVWDLNFELVRKFEVTWRQEDTETNTPVVDLNELEWDPTSKTILSNVWYKDYIVRIWPGTGKVIQVFDMSTLQSGGGNVLNGIAQHSANKWWITGKEWRNLYLIEFLE